MKHLISLFLRFVPRKYLHRFSHFAARSLSVFYLGNVVECPVCEKHYRKFLPYGRIHTRKNSLCPNCLSLERHRLMWLYLKDKTDFFSKENRLLHIAPELCFLKPFGKLKNIDYFTADLESPWAKVKMDVHHIPFPDNSFDVVFANHLMEHVDNDILAMQEIRRVLKPDGWGIIQSPININREITYENPEINSPKEREEHYGQSDHVREFGLDYPERLRKGGFKVVVEDFIKNIEPEKRKRYALMAHQEITAEEMIYRVEK
jgi:SAM-dependent methyltransferase